MRRFLSKRQFDVRSFDGVVGVEVRVDTVELEHTGGEEHGGASATHDEHAAARYRDIVHGATREALAEGVSTRGDVGVANGKNIEPNVVGDPKLGARVALGHSV